MNDGKSGGLEAAMFRPVSLWILLALLWLGVVVAIGFGALVLSGVRGGERAGAPARFALAIADIPSRLRHLGVATRDPYRSPDDRRASERGLRRAPGFTDPGYALLALYDPAAKRPLVRLMRLADGHVVRDYAPSLEALRGAVQRVRGPVMITDGMQPVLGYPDLLDDGGIVFNGNYVLARTGACSETRWSDIGYHHSIERDGDGGLWAPGVLSRPERQGVGPRYHDDAIVRIDQEGRRGRVLPLGRIFAANGLDARVSGHEYSDDPFHLNDVEPVPADGPYWRRGDLFLSLRNQAMLILYRPSTGRILWQKTGPWSGQHDVSILDDHRIAVLDNHVAFEPDTSTPRVRGTSRVLVYDFATGAISSPWEAAMRGQGLAIATGGRAQVLADGDLVVEDTPGGQLVRLAPDGSVRWRYLNADAGGRHYRLFWSRYLDPARYRAGLAAAQGALCG